MSRSILPRGSAPQAPPALRPGDLVCVVSPSGPAPAGPLTAGLQRLSSRYRLRAAENLFARHGYLAGEDGRRRDALHNALRDPDVRAVLCARGGYGVQRILTELDGSVLRADPKPIVGFSDVTALLCWALTQGVVSVHGPVVTQLPRLPSGDLEHLFRLLEDPTYAPQIPGNAGARDSATPAAQGRLVGGNLSLLGALAGTPWAPTLAGRLLALEEVGEAPYRLDRLLTTLRLQSGSLSTDVLAGVAVGALHGCAPGAAGGPSALEVVAERLRIAERPLVAGLPFGHDKRNMAFGVGVQARLDPATGTLAWEGGVVA